MLGVERVGDASSHQEVQLLSLKRLDCFKVVETVQRGLLGVLDVDLDPVFIDELRSTTRTHYQDIC